MKLGGLIALIFAGALLVPGAALAKNKENIKKIEELNKKVQAASDVNDLQTAILSSEDALSLTIKEFGDKSQETGEALNNTANLYLFSGNPENAERLYKESILILAAKKDKEGLEMADYYFNLGMAYAMQKKYDEASKILNQCLQIKAKKLGNKNPETQKVQSALADVWEQQKQLPI